MMGWLFYLKAVHVITCKKGPNNSIAISIHEKAIFGRESLSGPQASK
jgi:hypothetical protein